MAPEREVPVKGLAVLALTGLGAWLGSQGGLWGALTGLFAGFEVSRKMIAPALPATYEVGKIGKYHSPHHIFKDISPPFEEEKETGSGSKHSWLFKDI